MEEAFSVSRGRWKTEEAFRAAKGFREREIKLPFQKLSPSPSRAVRERQKGEDLQLLLQLQRMKGRYEQHYKHCERERTWGRSAWRSGSRRLCAEGGGPRCKAGCRLTFEPNGLKALYFQAFKELKHKRFQQGGRADVTCTPPYPGLLLGRHDSV